jgi:hypothetical protein
MFSLHTLALNNKNSPTNLLIQSVKGTKRTRQLNTRIKLFSYNRIQRTTKFINHALKPNAPPAAAVRDLLVVYFLYHHYLQVW